MENIILYLKTGALTILPIAVGIYLYKKSYRVIGIILILVGVVILGSLIYAIKTFS